MDGMIDKGGMAPEKQKAVEMLQGAEQGGKLAKLQALMDERQWPTDAATILMLAQKAPETRGKSPDELEAAIRADEALYDKLTKALDEKPKGIGDALSEMKDGADAEGPSAPEPDEPTSEEDKAEMSKPMGIGDRLNMMSLKKAKGPPKPPGLGE